MAALWLWRCLSLSVSQVPAASEDSAEDSERSRAVWIVAVCVLVALLGGGLTYRILQRVRRDALPRNSSKSTAGFDSRQAAISGTDSADGSDSVDRVVWRVEPQAGSIGNLKLRHERFVCAAELPGGMSPDARSSPSAAPRSCFATVRIAVSGLNFADVFAVQGLYSATPPGPFVPGLELAGIVQDIHHFQNEADDGAAIAASAASAAAGAAALTLASAECPRCSRFSRGMRVFGVTRFGAYASVANVDLRCIRAIPPSWSFEIAAAFPAQAMTAHFGLFKLGALRAGQTVLIHSAAGGVGLFALHLAQRHSAAIVTTVGSATKAEFLVRRFGLKSEQVIVRTAPAAFGGQLDRALATLQSDGFDLIFDSLLGRYFDAGWQRLRHGGRCIVFGAADMAQHSDAPTSLSRCSALRLLCSYASRPRLDPLAMISQNRGVLAFNLIWLWQSIDALGASLDDLLRIFADERSAIHVGHRFPFDNAPAALRFALSGKSIGKIVLQWPLALEATDAAAAQ
jgi:alcohol dehydrogenase